MRKVKRNLAEVGGKASMRRGNRHGLDGGKSWKGACAAPSRNQITSARLVTSWGLLMFAPQVGGV